MICITRQLLTLGLLIVASGAFAEQPVVGRKAAQKYFSRAPADDSTAVEVIDDDATPPTRSHSRARSESSGDHYLSLHIGGYVDSQAYSWGKGDDQKNVGKQNLGVTYRFNDWSGKVDLMFRGDLIWYEPGGGGATKLSLLPMLIFPEATSRFPLYFGFGVGPGVYLRQISGESSLALDYQLVVGARFFDLLGNAGLTIETGLKNHLHLLGNGQFNGVFLALGTVFTF